MAVKTKVGARRRLIVLSRRLKEIEGRAEAGGLTEAESDEFRIELALIKSQLRALGDVLDEIEADDAR